MSDTTLRVLATCRVRADRIDEAKEALLSLVAPSQAEPGCILYDLQQDREDETAFAFVEEWVDDAALATHGQSAHVQAARERFPDLLDGGMTIRKYTLVR